MVKANTLEGKYIVAASRSNKYVDYSTKAAVFILAHFHLVSSYWYPFLWPTNPTNHSKDHQKLKLFMLTTGWFENDYLRYPLPRLQFKAL